MHLSLIHICCGLDGRLHQLDALVKGQQRGFARGAGDDQRIAQIVLDKVLDQFGIAVVIYVLVLVIGRDEREQYLSVLLDVYKRQVYPLSAIAAQRAGADRPAAFALNKRCFNYIMPCLH